MYGTPEKQKFFGESGFTRIGVTDNGKGATTLNF
jgi:hypothetical protein